MHTFIGLLVLAAFILWVWKGRRSTAAIINNIFLGLLAGAGGVAVLLLGSGVWDVLLGMLLLGYAIRAFWLTIPWIRERLDPNGR